MRGMSKTGKIASWLRSGGNASYGSLHLMCSKVYTYDVLLAHVDRQARTAVVNVQSYSVTSSGHRNRLLEALNQEGYSVQEVEGPIEIQKLVEG